MIRFKVLGIGSPYGADRLGWQIVDMLNEEPLLQALIPNQLSLLSCDRPGMELLDLMKETQVAILIDAVKTQQPPGAIVRLENFAWQDSSVELSTHNIGVVQTLALGEALNVLPETVIIYGLSIGESKRLAKPEQLNLLKSEIMSEIIEQKKYKISRRKLLTNPNPSL